MTEREYMNRDDEKKILKVNLCVDSGVDYLKFNLGTKTHNLNLNTEDSQLEIKKMFCDLIPLLNADFIEFVLETEEGYDNNLLREVSESYIGDLNKELATVRTEILDREEGAEE